MEKSKQCCFETEKPLLCGGANPLNPPKNIRQPRCVYRQLVGVSVPRACLLKRTPPLKDPLRMQEWRKALAGTSSKIWPLP
jgi:hypothetical protein